MNSHKENTYALSRAENRAAVQRIAVALGWLALFALIISTGIHAVSLVIANTRQAAGFLYAVRIGSPILTEIFAALVAIGFAVHAWRAGQKLVGLGIEVIWFCFAALNLLVSFTTESGGTLPTVLNYWLHYGLPVSALAAGGLFYVMYRLDPLHQRAAEYRAAEERDAMDEFVARLDVRNSPQMAAIRRQQAWLDEVGRLEREGYSGEQIAFMLSAVPELNRLVLNTGSRHLSSLDGIGSLNGHALAEALTRYSEDRPAQVDLEDGEQAGSGFASGYR